MRTVHADSAATASRGTKGGGPRRVDCLLIGHNQVEFPQYERHVRSMGIDTPAYRDLSMSFLPVGDTPMTAREIWTAGVSLTTAPHARLRFFDSFSATIAYLGSYLDRRGLSFEYVESFQDEKDQLRALLASADVLTVAVTTTYYTDPEPIVEIVAFVRSVNERARIVVGGPFVATQVRTSGSDDHLAYLLGYIGADVYVDNAQGEETLVRLIVALKEGRPWDDIENLIIPANGRYTRTPAKPEASDLAENRVNWTLFSGRLREYANLRSAISCPFACAFCSFPEHAGAYRLMPVDVLEQELDELAEDGTVRGVMFVDDTFNVPRRRFQQVLRMLIRNGYGFKWFGNVRCQYLDEETVALMKESGCNVVFLGLESGSNAVLAHMNKGATVEQYRAGIRLLRAAGITTFGSFVIGFPGETSETVIETIRFVDQSGIDFYRANLWYCERITPVWRARTRYRLEGDGFQWRHQTMDSDEASDLVEGIFLAVDGPVWVPIHDFDIVSVWHLLSRGYSAVDVKTALKVFNVGLRQRLAGRPAAPGEPSPMAQLASVLDRMPLPRSARTAGSLAREAEVRLQ